MSVEKVKNQLFYIGLLFIFVFSIFVRLKIVDFDRIIAAGDETAYENSAENLLQYGMFTLDREGGMREGLIEPTPTSALQIGYPVVISIIYVLFGHNEKYVWYFQFVLSIMDLWLMYAIMCQCKCKRRGIILALALAACYPGFIYNINRMLTEQLFKTLLLLFVYFLCRAFATDNKLKWYIFSACTCGAAVFVRGLVFPFTLLVVCIILLYEQEKKIKLILTFSISFLLTQGWWWIRNFILFHRFIPLSDAGESPKIWGLMPYYLDMTSSNGYTAEALLELDKAINLPIFLRWKIFGQTNWLWNNIWDEQLVHPQLRWALWIQILLILIGILLPVLIKKCDAYTLLITSFPIAFTILHIPYHGLPRYLYPAIPFLFIALAMLLSGNNRELCHDNVEDRHVYLFRKWCIRLYYWTSILFSLLLFFSIFIFNWFITADMSQWRLNKYANISIEEVDKNEVTWQKDYNNNEVTIENCIDMQNGVWVNDNISTSIMRVECTPINENCITKVDIEINGGYLYDYVTVYWQDTNMTCMDEDHYYQFPTNIFQKHFTLYIDGDVSALQIVPYTFRGGKFVYRNIHVSKTAIPNLSPRITE